LILKEAKVLPVPYSQWRQREKEIEREREREREYADKSRVAFLTA